MPWENALYWDFLICSVPRGIQYPRKMEPLSKRKKKEKEYLLSTFYVPGPLLVLYILLSLILITLLWDRYGYPHFSDEEMELRKIKEQIQGPPARSKFRSLWLERLWTLYCLLTLWISGFRENSPFTQGGRQRGAGDLLPKPSLQGLDAQCNPIPLTCRWRH